MEAPGSLTVHGQLPAGAPLGRTPGVMKHGEGFFMKQPEVDQVVAVLGFSFSGQGQNSGLVFVPLKDWDERKTAPYRRQKEQAPGDGVRDQGLAAWRAARLRAQGVSMRQRGAEFCAERVRPPRGARLHVGRVRDNPRVAAWPAWGA